LLTPHPQASSSTQAVLVSQAHGALNVTAMRGWLILSTVGFGVVTVIVSLVFFLTPQVLGGIGMVPCDVFQRDGVELIVYESCVRSR
jgi:hypothetical protein